MLHFQASNALSPQDLEQLLLLPTMSTSAGSMLLVLRKSINDGAEDDQMPQQIMINEAVTGRN